MSRCIPLRKLVRSLACSDCVFQRLVRQADSFGPRALWQAERRSIAVGPKKNRECPGFPPQPLQDLANVLSAIDVNFGQVSPPGCTCRFQASHARRLRIVATCRGMNPPATIASSLRDATCATNYHRVIATWCYQGEGQQRTQAARNRFPCRSEFVRLLPRTLHRVASCTGPIPGATYAK